MHQYSRWFFPLSFATVCFATAGWMVFDGQSLGGPVGALGDDVFFENIAWNLANGQGIRVDFTDPEWRRPYLEANQDGVNDRILALGHKGLTTSRSPGFPVLVSWIYRIAGRDFAAVRLVNIVLLAAAISLLLHAVFRFHGWLAATLALITVSLDCFVLRTAGQFMTEALGTVVVCCLVTACIWLTNSPVISARRGMILWCTVGILFGLGMLVRANMNLWFVLIAAGLGVILVWRVVRQREWSPVLHYGLAFGVGTLLVVSPWWVRNCMVTGGFSPFGTSGAFGLVGGYCDEAWEDFGNWSLDASLASQQQSIRRAGFRQLTLPQQELVMGADSERLALEWIRENREKLPALFGMKMLSHLGFYRLPLPMIWLNGLMLFGMVIGCMVTRKSTGFWIALALALSLISTGLTWSHYGRYSIPIRPLIHVSSAIGTVVFWSFVFQRLIWSHGFRRRSLNRPGK